MAAHPEDCSMAKRCQAIVNSNNLEEARTHFKECRDLAIPMAREKQMMP